MVQNRIQPIVVYDLNVVSFSDIREILQDDGDSIPFNTGQYDADRLVWFWTDWQVCDRCGIFAGEQKRFGTFLCSFHD